jgi:hypothetical protein
MPYKKGLARKWTRERLHRSPSILALLPMFPQEQQSYVDNDNGDDSTGACQPDPAVQDPGGSFYPCSFRWGDYVSLGTCDQGTTALVIPSNVTVVGSGTDSSTISISGLTRCVVEPFDRFVRSGFHPPNYRHNRRGLRDWQRRQRFCWCHHFQLSCYWK